MTSGVRPIDVEPEPPRRGALLAAAAVVGLVGFGVFLANGNLSVSAPTTTADPPPTTTTTVPPTDDPAAAPDRLRTLVPGFQGSVRAVLLTADGSSKAWTWASGEGRPRLVDLPARSRGSWAPGQAVVAAIGASSFGSSLYFGPPTNIREVFNDVEGFVWHTTQPATLAFVTVPQPDGMRELWRSLPDETTPAVGTFNASRVMRFDFDARLVAYGDWGFAMESNSPSAGRPVQLSTFDPEGTPVATAPFALAADFGDGRLLAIIEPSSDCPRPAVTDIALGAFEPVGPDGSFGTVAISPNKRWVASVTLPPQGAVLALTNLDGEPPQSIPLGVDVALPVAWSADGRWILVLGSPDAPASSGLTQLIFVRAVSHDISIVTTAGTLSGFSIEATGAPGPNSFS